MAHAYTPGLRVAEKVKIQKSRVLPLPGEILVKRGDKVKAETVVAKTELPGKVFPVNVAGRLSIPPGEVPKYMLKKEGNAVEKDEIIAESKSFLAWLRASCFSPIKGTIESISTVTGQVLLREPPQPLEVKAYIDGEVVEVMEGEGVVVETVVTFIQGIFGIGGETVGPLEVAVDSPDAVLTPERIKGAHKGKVLVGGSLVRKEALDKAIKMGVKGIVVGGIFDEDLKELLGYDLGVAITGSENIGLTLVVTEGFSQISMVKRTFELLQGHAGMKASINGATQIRAGVLRPEVIISLPGGAPPGAEEVPVEGGMEVGDMVRIIREPHFGRIGRVKGLPVKPQTIETETSVRVVEVKFTDDSSVIIPRANVELIKL
ncbi:MAG TPA: hypothetical protein ACFYD1_04500 [Candidatus Hypogeohydataceae bacterium YC38]